MNSTATHNLKLSVKELKLRKENGLPKQPTMWEMKEDLIRKLFTKKLVSWGWHKRDVYPYIPDVYVNAWDTPSKVIGMDFVDEEFAAVGWIRWESDNTREGKFTICLNEHQYERTYLIDGTVGKSKRNYSDYSKTERYALWELVIMMVETGLAREA